MNVLSKSVLAAMLMLIMTSCYYDHEALLYENGPCEIPVSPSFTTDVLPLLNARCNNCHAGTSPSAGIKLNTHAEVMKYVNNGSLMGSINHSSGFSAMPKNGSKMSACDINKIQSWIDSGASDN
jgi:uncharacterized membrane protein